MPFGTSKFGQLGFLWIKLRAIVDESWSRKRDRRDESSRDQRNARGQRDASYERNARGERDVRYERDGRITRVREVSNEVSSDLDAYVVRLVTIAFLVAVIFSSPSITVNAVPQTFNAERALLEDANRERVAQGLSPLRWNANLAAAAHNHALLMAQHDALSHQFSGEAPLQDRTRSAGARFTEVAENVAEGPSAEMIHASWMHSPPHRANLLDPELTDIGIAIAVGSPGPGSGRGPMLFAVQDFSQAVAELSLNEQERQVAAALVSRGLQVTNLAADPNSAPAVKRSSKDSASVRNASAVTTSNSAPRLAIGGIDDARKTCVMDHGWSGPRPGLIARYESGNLSRLPENLEKKISSKHFHSASVGACEPTSGSQGFVRFRVAILLY
jgi:uncharacterized protein YkwD